MEITAPLQCAKCGSEFVLEQGGICAACNKLFCLTHLKVEGPKDKKQEKPITPVCVDCHRDVKA